jgi:hypothetical protein
MATTTIIPLHIGKGKSAKSVLEHSADYMKNSEKTANGEWVTAYECDPLTAAQEFLFSRSQYTTATGKSQGANEVVAYHIRQSFLPGEIDPATANRLGCETAMSFTKGKFAFICCTHVEKQHIHSHILINAVNLDCTRKFRNFKGSSFALRRISDKLCAENGLSIIENPQNSRGSYADWLDKKEPQTKREELQKLIDNALSASKTYDEFIAAMLNAECEVKQGKYLAFKLKNAERFIR